MGPTRVAVIGCGRIGTEGHLPAYATAARAGLCTLVGVCDLDLRSAQVAARPFGVPAFGSAEELLAHARPGVVSIATHPSSHRDLALQALAGSCHVLCEKPVAMHVGEAAEMVQAAERAGRLLSIVFEYRYWDESAFVRQRIAAGDFGHIHHVRTWGGAAHGFPTSAGFHRRAIAGGGVLTHWTIHNLDLAIWLLGNPEPLTASAFRYQRLAHLPAGSFPRPGGVPNPEAVDPDIEDFAVGLVRLDSGTAVTVEANWFQPPSSRPEGWELLGDRAAASISPLRLWVDRGGAWIDETPPSGTLAPCDYDLGRVITGFLHQVRAGGPPPVSGSEVLRIQRLMDALYESAALGREVTIDDRAAGVGRQARGVGVSHT